VDSGLTTQVVHEWSTLKVALFILWPCQQGMDWETRSEAGLSEPKQANLPRWRYDVSRILVAEVTAQILKARTAIPIHSGSRHSPRRYVEVEQPVDQFVSIAAGFGVRHKSFHRAIGSRFD
jgi:hypothetical protein